MEGFCKCGKKLGKVIYSGPDGWMCENCQIAEIRREKMREVSNINFKINARPRVNSRAKNRS